MTHTFKEMCNKNPKDILLNPKIQKLGVINTQL